MNHPGFDEGGLADVTTNVDNQLSLLLGVIPKIT
jgi:hypothetical protein